MEPLFQVTQWRSKEDLRQLYWYQYRRSVANWVDFCLVELYLLLYVILLLLWWRFSLALLVSGLMVLYVFLVRRRGNRAAERIFNSDPAMQNTRITMCLRPMQ